VKEKKIPVFFGDAHHIDPSKPTTHLTVKVMQWEAVVQWERMMMRET
jgi:hypothetical protein